MTEYREDPPEVRAEFARKALAEALAEIEQRGGLPVVTKRAGWERRLDEALDEAEAIAGVRAVRARIDARAELRAPRKRGRKRKVDLASLGRAVDAWLADPGAKHYLLAQAAGISESDFSDLFRDPRFQQRAGRIVAHELDQDEAERDNAALDLKSKVEGIARDRLPQWVAERWAGPVHSMAADTDDAVVYVNPADYVAHLIAAGQLPNELLKEVRAELAAKEFA